jgi:ketosteroid isomerase-like protein
MKKSLLVLFAVTLGYVTVAQNLSNPNLQSLIDAERAFSQLAKDKTTREAFLANLIEESISFSPGITPALKLWQQQPENDGWLYWQPAYADISASGEFGYTTGPWSWHNTKQDKPNGFGEYITVWRKQSSGQWKVLIDAGISHDTYPVDGHTIATSSIASTSDSKKKETPKETISEKDNAFNLLLAKDNTIYPKFVSAEVKFYRNGSLPFTKVSDLKPLVNTIYTNAGTQSSIEQDMAFTYGTVETTGADAKVSKLSYLRIWKKENGRDWKIVIDLIG